MVNVKRPIHWHAVMYNATCQSWCTFCHPLSCMLYNFMRIHREPLSKHKKKMSDSLRTFAIAIYSLRNIRHRYCMTDWLKETYNYLHHQLSFDIRYHAVLYITACQWMSRLLVRIMAHLTSVITKKSLNIIGKRLEDSTRSYSFIIRRFSDSIFRFI